MVPRYNNTCKEIRNSDGFRGLLKRKGLKQFHNLGLKWTVVCRRSHRMMLKNVHNMSFGANSD